MKIRAKHVAVAMLSLQSPACRRERRAEPAAPVVAGPNALGPDGRLRGAPATATAPVRATRVALATGLTEGRVKPPDDKPNDDEDRDRVHPEWYQTGRPENPYPAGTVIPATPPPAGLSITPIPAPGAAPSQPSMQPMGQPSMQPMGQPSMQPMGQPSMQPMGGPTLPSAPQPGQGGVTMVPIPAPGVPSTGMAAPPPVVPTTQAPTPAVQPTGSAAGQVFQGQLGASSQRDAEGRFFDVREVSLRRGSRVAVTLQSAQFDTMLRVEPPTGDAIENDDVAPDNTNSRVDFTAPIDGRYRVTATSYAPAATGAYTMQVSAGEPGAGLIVTGGGTAADAQTGAGGTLVPGTPVNEYLTPGDPSSGGRYVRGYRMNGQQGDMVTLRVTSPGFDTTLALVSPNGQRWSNDDTTPSDTNSTIQLTLPMGGSYRVEVSSFRTGATGPFTLALTSSARPVVAAGGPVRDTAGRNGQGTMYGVFVGISDYGSQGNLYGCASDARQLAQAYLDARLGEASNFVVLTDAEATTTAVQQAFRTLAPRVGPEDVFMFFHSGHGSRHPSQDAAADPDGFVESIVLRDGEINSHQMSALFDGMQPNVGMLALDSCFSGGFERAFSGTRNRFGMYSSEADVLSQVAERFQAGGYLSYFLRRGVSEADDNHDGAVRAGELADYLQRQYAQNLQSMHTQDGSDVDTWQHLVINRSGVALSDQLWRFPLVQGVAAR